MTSNRPSAVIRLALEAPADRASVEAFAAQNGWVLQETFAADAAHGFEIIWSIPDRDAEVHYVEDAIAGQAFLALLGPQAESLAATIRSQLTCADLSDVLLRCRHPREHDDLSTLAGLLGVLGPGEFDNDVMHTLADLLQSSQAQVRLRALNAVASLGWPELRPLVTAVAIADETDFVRWRAEDVLKAYDRVDANLTEPPG